MQSKDNKKKVTESSVEDKIWICRPWITLPNGQRLYASSVGKKAFCFWAKPRKTS